MSIELPDLEAATDVEIVADNVRAVGTIHSVWLLEQAAIFQVVDRIVELFSQGSLPLSRGHAGRALYRLWRAGDRTPAPERAACYARALGAQGGDAGGEPNREFLALWLRFLAAVSAYVRRRRGAAGLTAPSTVSNAAVRGAARDLTANASAYGGEPVLGAARRLKKEVGQMFDVLGEPELLQAFGAQSVWQLIERVQQQALGGARNVARFRSQANAGSLIFEWLASAAGAQADTGGAGDDAALAEAVESLLSAMTAAEPHDLLAAVEGGRKAGFSALFLGSPGSGKTLAAHVLASTLELPIMRVDLSRVVSQYIGETEKNLAALFEQAEQKDFVLFFDEADALFGRRTEVRDSHDRYANEAIDYLLQRIEAYEGALIVASNSPKNSDAALTRGGARRRWRVVRFPR